MDNYVTHQEFLLSLDFAQEAFVNLVKKKEIVDKEELLREIERLMVEDIRKQIKGKRDIIFIHNEEDRFGGDI